MSKAISRRTFLKSAARLAAAGGLALLAWRLLGFGRWGKRTREICVNEGICRGCPTFTLCGLPAALSARDRAPWARSTL
jgi:hypothetical protein